MTYATSMVQANPNQPHVEMNVLVEGIQACFDCAQACTADADADLGEQAVQGMIRCIRLCLDCADVCLATGKILSRMAALDFAARATLHACAQTCKACGDECQYHAEQGIAHCQTCLEACRRCEQACTTLLSALQA